MYSAIETLAEPHPVSFLVSVLDPRFQEYKKLVRAISLSRDFFNFFFFLSVFPLFSDLSPAFFHYPRFLSVVVIFVFALFTSNYKNYFIPLKHGSGALELK